MEIKEVAVEDVDISFVYNFLSTSYWGKERTYDEVKKSIQNSVNFMVYDNKNPVGYARIATDGVFFAYLMDVFIIETYRGKGLGMQLVDYVLNHSSLKTVETWMLSTADAQGLYERFGFKRINEKLMRLRIV